MYLPEVKTSINLTQGSLAILTLPKVVVCLMMVLHIKHRKKKRELQKKKQLLLPIYFIFFNPFVRQHCQFLSVNLGRLAMAADGAGGGVWASVTSLVSSPTSRTAIVTVCASALAVVLLQVSPLLTSKKLPKVPDKDHPHHPHQDQDHLSRGRSGRSVSSSSLSLVDSKNSVAIFWDVDNCSPPTGSSGHSVAQSIRRAAQAAAKLISNSDRNVSIVSFKAYLELTTEGSQPSASRVQLHSELQGSGVSLIDTPKSGRKDVADKMMITDLLSFAIDKRPPALIVLLSGDRDFAYPLGILRNRGYEILLVVPPIGATPILEASANHVMRWRQDVLGLERDAHGRLYDKPSRDIDGARGKANSVKEIDNGKPAASKGIPTSRVPSQSIAQSSLVSTLKGPGAPPVPSIFLPLVYSLEQMRKEGQSRPLRSQCAARLLAQDINVYTKAGATSWGDYAAVAEAANIVTLGEGSKPGMEWIALRSIHEGTLSNLKTLEKNASAPPIPNSSNIPDDIAIFHPLIEVYKSIKAGLPKAEYPTVTQMTAQLTRMWEVGLRDAYAQAGVNNFTAYMALAEEANVGRLAKTESKPYTNIVQIHPKYANLHTGIITPSSNEAKMIDTSKTTVPPAGPSGLASILGLGKKSKDKETKEAKETKDVKETKEKSKQKINETNEIKEAKENGKSASNDLVPSTPLKGNEKSTLFHAHQPSGEKIHVSYFPLCNLLLTQRSEGKMTSSDSFVQSVLVKHPKIAHFVTTPEQFASYVSRAERDDIIISEGKTGKRLLRLHPRLCVGEEEHNKRRAITGVNSGIMKRSDSTEPIFTILQREKKETLPDSTEMTTSEEIEETNVANFGIEPATPQERVKFKPLVDTLVSLRREAPDVNTKSQLSKVSSTLVANHPIDGKIVSPGTWIQMQGYSSFVEYYQAAEKKGFIHLMKNEVDAKDRIRLAKKYEAMFFHSDA